MLYTIIEQNENAEYQPYLSAELYNRYKDNPNFYIMCAVDDEKENILAGLSAFLVGEVTDIKEISVIGEYDYLEIYKGLLEEICRILKESSVRVCSVSLYDDISKDLFQDVKTLLLGFDFHFDYSSEMYSTSIYKLDKNLKKYEDKLPQEEKVKALWVLNTIQENELEGLLSKNFMPLSGIDKVVDELSLVHLNEFDSVDGCIIASDSEEGLVIEYLYMKQNNSRAVIKLIGTCMDNARDLFEEDKMVTAVASTAAMKKMISELFGTKVGVAENYYKIL